MTPIARGKGTTLKDIVKARAPFKKAGLGFPTIPKKLAVSLKQQDEWLFSTRPIDISPYELQHYVRELDHTHVEDYALLCHSGHGINSYAIQYYLIHGAVAMFLFLGWGGVYMDNKSQVAKIRECFSLGDKISQAAQTVKHILTGNRVTIVASDFYDSYWLAPGKSVTAKCPDSKGAKAVLVEALGWLKSHQV